MTNCLNDVMEKFSDYEAALEADSLSNHTKRVFKSRVYNFLGFLRETEDQLATVLVDPETRDLAVQRYREHVQGHLKPASINAMVTALNHFFQFLGLGNTNLKRNYCPPVARKVLTEEEQARVLNAIKLCRSSKHRAIAKLLFYTGIKIGECVALNLNDVRINEKGQISINCPANSREVHLPEDLSKELSGWLAEREQFCSSSSALFLNRSGQRMSGNGIDLVVRKIGQYAHVELSAQLLRRTHFETKARNYINPSDSLGCLPQSSGFAQTLA